MKNLLAVAIFLSVLTSQSAIAITISAVDTGVFTFREYGGGIGGGMEVIHQHANQDFGFSFPFIDAGSFYQNGFAVFDLSEISGTVISASLNLELDRKSVV